ncbi:phage portal protein [Clostridium sp.]|uniref:phage portal protein n=1 Tax=Clostridium sp. TaxID=1506 RepID=UPI002FC77E21
MGLIESLFKNGEVKLGTEDGTEGSTTVSVDNSSANITEDSALGIAALYQGISVISDSISAMPIFLYRDVDGYQQLMEDDPRNRLMSGMANEVLTSYNLKKVIVKDLILHGNAYIKINRSGALIESLTYIPVDSVKPKFDNSGYYFEVSEISTGVDGEKIPSEIIDFYDMLVLIRNNKYNSILGQGILDMASKTLDTSIEEENYMRNLFKNGLSSRAILNSKTPLRKEIKDKLRLDLKNLYSGVKNAGSVMVLEGDMQLIPLTLTPSDVKLIESRNFSITEISRWLNVPKHMLNMDRSQGMYSNITQERQQLLTNTLTPFMIAIEESLNQKLLTDEERAQEYYFKFDTSELLRLTPEDQSAYMLNLYQAGVVTVEEVRSALNFGADETIVNELKQIKQTKTQENNTINNSEKNNEDAPVEEKDQAANKEENTKNAEGTK